MVNLYETGEPWKTIAQHQHATLDELEREHVRNEQAAHRVVGLVVETRPSLITPENLTFLRTLGATKVQMGIQSLDQHIHDINQRPVNIMQIDRALDLTRLFGFKTHTHFMVNLLGQTPESDKQDFRRFVTETPYQPDEIKLYPCALVRGTELCERYERNAGGRARCRRTRNAAFHAYLTHDPRFLRARHRGRQQEGEPAPTGRSLRKR